MLVIDDQNPVRTAITLAPQANGFDVVGAALAAGVPQPAGTACATSQPQT